MGIDYWNKLGINKQIQKCSSKLKAYGGKPIKVYGKVKATL